MYNMKLKLTAKPKKSTIIEGFPGYGLVGTIVTNYLIDKLNAKPIGTIWAKEFKPIVAIHKSTLVHPLEIYHNKKHNIVIVQALNSAKDMEWDIADLLVQLADQIDSPEIISIDGVGQLTPTKTSNVYYFTNNTRKEKKLKIAKVTPLNEGIVMGVSAALLMQSTKRDIVSLFAETQTGLPDREAAAEVIKVLDKYLGLKVNYKPLYAEAKKFEDQLKKIMEGAQKAVKDNNTKPVSYLG